MVSKRARATNTVGTRLNAIQEGMNELAAKTRTPAPDDTGARLEAVERKLELLGSAHYRADEDLLVRGSDHALALLDPSYIGPGPARVAFLSDGVLSSDYYPWRGPYHPWGNRVVNMIRIDGRWHIHTHSGQSMDPATGAGYGGIEILPLYNDWVNYSLYTGSYQYAEAQAQKLPSGIVVLSGLVGNGAIASGTVVTKLPPGMRPDTDTIFPTLNGNNWRAITVYANGDVALRGGMVSSYISLDGIAFPAAGVAAWTEVGSAGSGSSYGAGTTAHPSTNFGTPAYWKDPYGLVWFRGLVVSGNTTTDNYTMINLPAGYRSVLQQHMAATSSDNFGLVGATISTGLNWKNGTIGTSWVSLGGVTILTDEAMAATSWWVPPFSSSWVNYDPAIYPSFGITRRPDGMALAKGLVKNGSLGGGVRLATAPRHLLPAMTSLTPRPSAAAPGRGDVYGHRNSAGGNAQPGTISANFGAASWFSFDGMKWMVGEL